MTRKPTPVTILDAVLGTTLVPAEEPIRNDAIKIDGGTQMRAQLDAATVAEYADTMAEAGWGKFPPIIAYYDGSDYWLADGFHRLAAFRSIANFSDALIPADVRSGTRRDAILHAAGANASHGLRRTNADKRRAVETLLRDEEWAKWSDREIGRRCAVSDVFVGKVRADLSANGLQIPTERTVMRGGTTYTQNTANVGAKPGPTVPPIPAPTAKEYAAAVQAVGQSPISNLPPQPVTVDVLPPSDAPLPDWAQDPTSISKPGQSVADYLAYKAHADANGGAYLNIRDWRQWLDNGAPVIESDADISPPDDRIIGYSVVDDIALRDSTAPAAAYDVVENPDERIPAARALIRLYQSVLDSEETFGDLTGRYSAMLPIQREIKIMITQLVNLIHIIQHPEEVTPDN